MNNALEEEVRVALFQENREEDFQKWKDGELDASHVKITISYDMGWNKRSSGNRYDSISGHGVAIGSLTKKVVAIKTYSRSCVVCEQRRILIDSFR